MAAHPKTLDFSPISAFLAATGTRNRLTAIPELLEPSRVQLENRCALDGEIVVAKRTLALDFEALRLRIHPAASRVKLEKPRWRRGTKSQPSPFYGFDF